MRTFAVFLIGASLALAQPKASPFAGRWDLTVRGANGSYPGWLGVTEKDGKLEVWYQPRTGNVYQVKDFRVDGSHLGLALGERSLELEAAGGKLTGSIKRGTESQGQVIGVRAPELKRAEPKQWSAPEPLFNGKDLSGWEAFPATATSHWAARDGELVNQDHGANLKTTRRYNDFKLHVEFNCPDGGNSGLYLRGRYEVQVEYEPDSHNPPERRLGSIYGFLTPKLAPKKPGQWETFDITLVGRTVTVMRDGITVIDHQEIPGITGGAFDSDEAEPGPFYIQGDHTGGLKFRNIQISVPKN